MATKCKSLLADMIKENLRDHHDYIDGFSDVPKKKQYKSRSQAIAVAYRQINKSNPRCKQHIKSSKRRSRRSSKRRSTSFV